MHYPIKIPKLPENKSDMNQYYENAVNIMNRPWCASVDDEVKFYGSKLECLLPKTKNTTVRSHLTDIGDYLRRSRELGDILDESGVDENQVSAFVRGSAAGLLLVEEVHGRQLMKYQILTAAAMTQILREEFVLPELPSLLADKDDHAERAITLINDGLEVVGSEAGMMIDKWARDYTPENRHAFHMGVGVTALLGYRVHQDAHHVQEMQKLEDAIDAVTDKNFDWDTELSRLINPHQPK